MTKKQKIEVLKKVYDYISENINHNGNFVCSLINKFTDEDFFCGDIEELWLFNESGYGGAWLSHVYGSYYTYSIETNNFKLTVLGLVIAMLEFE